MNVFIFKKRRVTNSNSGMMETVTPNTGLEGSSGFVGLAPCHQWFRSSSWPSTERLRSTMEPRGRADLRCWVMLLPAWALGVGEHLCRQDYSLALIDSTLLSCRQPDNPPSLSPS